MLACSGWLSLGDILFTITGTVLAQFILRGLQRRLRPIARDEQAFSDR